MMEDTSWFEIFINWFPMLLLIGVWLFCMRKTFHKGAKSQTEYLQALEDLTAQQVKVLERIADALEDKNKTNNSN